MFMEEDDGLNFPPHPPHNRFFYLQFQFSRFKNRVVLTKKTLSIITKIEKSN